MSFSRALEQIPANGTAIWKAPAKDEDGAWLIEMHPTIHEAVEALIKALYDNHFVQDFDWPKWQPTALMLHNEPSRLSRATLSTCVKLLTLHVRKDRFVSGHFAAMVSDGHISLILKRLAELNRHSMPFPAR